MSFQIETSSSSYSTTINASTYFECLEEVLEEHVEDYEETDQQCEPSEYADYADGTFWKLRDCGISAASKIKGPGKEMIKNSWDAYQRLVKLYDLVVWSVLETQFTTNAVDLQKYGLSEYDVKAVTGALVDNKQVTCLNLSENILKKNACGNVANMLGKNKVIKHLQLCRCKIDSEAAAELAGALEKTSLETLDLSYNEIGNPGLHFVLDALQTNKYLQELDLSRNNLTKGCGRDISTFLEINEDLKTINLSDNYIDKKTDLNFVVRSICNMNETLTTVIMRWNGISGEECAGLFKTLIMKSETLRVLDISWNNFRDVGKIFGPGIKKSAGLEHLDVSNNPLTTEDMVELLNSVQEPTSLKILGLTHVLVDETLEKAILNVQTRMPDFQVRVGVYTNIRRKPTDLQSLYLRRLHYLGVTKPKKKTSKIDIGHALLKLKETEQLVPMKTANFTALIAALKIKGAEEIIPLLAKEFRNTAKKIDVELMLNKYMELYPDTVLPPSKK